MVHPFQFIVVVLACEGTFCPFFAKDIVLLFSELGFPFCICLCDFADAVAIGDDLSGAAIFFTCSSCFVGRLAGEENDD